MSIKPLTTEEVVELDLVALVGFLLESKDNRAQFLASFLMWQVSTQVRQIRTQRGWSQKELARRAGIHSATVIRLEDAERCLATTIDTLLKVARAFDCGLVVRFAAYSDLLKEIRAIKGDINYIVPGISEDILDAFQSE